MHKVVWNGDTLSTNESDGAWAAAYSNTLGEGTAGKTARRFQ